MLSQIELLGQSNKTAYTFLSKKSKILPIKQQLKWCENLQIPPESIDWKKIYENNYFSTIEAKLRSFHTKLQVNIKLSRIHKLFGFQENSTDYKFLNNLMLLVRFFIYYCKYSKSKPNMWNNLMN